MNDKLNLLKSNPLARRVSDDDIQAQENIFQQKLAEATQPRNIGIQEALINAAVRIAPALIGAAVGGKQGAYQGLAASPTGGKIIDALQKGAFDTQQAGKQIEASQAQKDLQRLQGQQDDLNMLDIRGEADLDIFKKKRLFELDNPKPSDPNSVGSKLDNFIKSQLPKQMGVSEEGAILANKEVEEDKEQTVDPEKSAIVNAIVSQMGVEGANKFFEEAGIDAEKYLEVTKKAQDVLQKDVTRETAETDLAKKKRFEGAVATPRAIDTKGFNVYFPTDKTNDTRLPDIEQLSIGYQKKIAGLKALDEVVASTGWKGRIGLGEEGIPSDIQEAVESVIKGEIEIEQSKLKGERVLSAGEREDIANRMFKPGGLFAEFKEGIARVTGAGDTFSTKIAKKIEAIKKDSEIRFKSFNYEKPKQVAKDGETGEMFYQLDDDKWYDINGDLAPFNKDINGRQ